MEKSMLDCALEYLDLGFPVVPWKTNKKGSTIPTWEDFKKRLPNRNEVSQWFENSKKDKFLAIVTGELANLLIIDVDTPEALIEIEKFMPESLEIPSVRSPRGGTHLYFRYPKGHNIGPIVGLIKDVDVRANGSVIVAPPSQNGTGPAYTWINKISKDNIPSLPPDLLNIIISKYNKSLYISNSLYIGKKDSDVTSVTNFPYEHHYRNNDLFHLAFSLLKSNCREEFVWETIKRIRDSFNKEDPFIPDSELRSTFESAQKRIERKERNIAEEVERWLDDVTSCYFFVTLMYQELHLLQKEEKTAARVALHRLIDKKITPGNKRGEYRILEKNFEEMDILSDSPGNANIVLPFGLGQLCTVPPGSVIVVAGYKSSGKTSFMLNMIAENLGRFGRKKPDIVYMNSELSDSELKGKIKAFRTPDIATWNKGFTAIRRSANWSDLVTNEDKLFFIDYIDIVDEFYKIGIPIKAISDKLRKGVAIIGIQKPKGRDIGIGGDRSLDKARLYIALDPDYMKIIDAKYPINDSCRGLMRKHIIRDKGSFFDFQTGWIPQEEKENVWTPKK